MQGEIWVIDDETGIRELISEILEDEGYLVKTAQNAAEARHLMQTEQPPSLALLDIWMPDTDGVTLLKEWKAAGSLVFPVVMLSGHATIDTAVEATKVGAFDFLEKPIGLQKLLSCVEKAIRHRPVSRGPNVNLDSMGTSEPVTQMKAKIENLIKGQNPIMLTGEMGVGFSEISRAIHSKNTAYVMLETGQRLVASPLDIMEQARGGTLFCEDITALTRTEQRSLLFILQRARQYNICVVCACNESLASVIAGGGFDQTLYSLLSQCEVAVPALRQRRTDIPDLVNRAANALLPNAATRISANAMQIMENAPWQGNLIQLNNVLSTVLFDARIETVEPAHLTPLLGEVAIPTQNNTQLPELSSAYFSMSLRDAREAFERLYFEHLLKREEFNMSRVADKSGLERTHLYRKLKQLNIKFTRRQGGGELSKDEENDGEAEA
jgi:two-component system, NtrC family, nitrogen regulation response regulator NtrX